MSKQSKNLFNTKDRFGIRKLTIGTASLLLGTVCYAGINSNEAQAAEEPQIEQSNDQATSTNGSTDQTSDQHTEKSTTETSSQDTTQPVEKVTDQTLKDTSNESTAQKYDQSSNDTTSQDTNQNDENKTDESSTTESSTTESKEVNNQFENNATEETTDQSNTNVNNQETEKETNQSTTQDSNQINKQTSNQTSNKENNQTINEKPVNNNNNVEKEAQNNQSSTENQTNQKTESESSQTNQPDLNKSTTSNNDSSSQTDKSTQPQESQPKIDNKESNEIVTNENSIQNDSNIGDTTTETQINNDKNNIETSEINNTDALTENKVQDSQPSQPANSQNLNDMPSSNSPFVTIDNATTNPSSPTNPKSPSDDAGEQANQPVVITRTRSTFAKPVMRAAVSPTADANVLSNDKFNVISLSGESKQGDDFNKNVYETHLNLKLDDSVKAGDVLKFGASYQYKDKDGNITKQYLSPIYNGGPRSTNIIYNDKVIGTMTQNNDFFNAESETRNNYNLYNPIYSLDELNNKNYEYSRNDKATIPPYTITFNDNINNLKNVELTIDNVYTQPVFYKDTQSSPQNTFQKNGKDYVTIQNAFDINGHTQELNIDVPVEYRNTGITKESPYSKNVITHTINHRTYNKTPDGKEYLINQGNNGTKLSMDISNTKPINSATFTFTVPKELMEVLNVTANGDNMKEIKSTTSSLYNPLTSNDDVYANSTSFSSDNSDIWKLSSQTKTLNDNGDTVYTFKYDTIDGSYVLPSQHKTPSIYYTLKNPSDYPASPIETYEDANKHATNTKWSVPKWDEMLKNNPMTVTYDANGENNEKISTSILHNKESYDVNIFNVQNVPLDAIRVLASDETMKTIPHKEETPYKTIVEFNPNLGKGERVVAVKGVNGVHSWDENIIYRNNEEVERTITNEQKINKVDEVVQVGIDDPLSFNSAMNNHEDITRVIPRDTIRVFNPDLPANSEDVVVDEGKDGIEHIKTKYTDGLTFVNFNEYIQNNQITNQSYSEIMTALQNQYKDNLSKTYGDKLNITQDFKFNPDTKQYEIIYEVDDEDYEISNKLDRYIEFAPVEVPFKTITNYVDTLKKGETVVENEGQTGLKNPETNEILTNSVDRVVNIGTGIKSNDVKTETEVIPFKEIIHEDKSKPEGYRNIDIKGENGERTITTTTPLLDGEVNGDPIVTSNITKQKIDQVVTVGTGVVSEDKQVKTEEIDYGTEIRENKDLESGTRNVIQKGEKGSITITTTTPLLNGEPNGKSDVKIDTKQPVKEIIEVGTGVSANRTVTTTTPVEFETEYRDNKDLPAGETRIIQTGHEGLDQTTTIIPTFNGEDTGKGESSIKRLIEPVDQIIERGTGVVGTTTETTTKDIQYKVNEVPDSSLKQGERVIEQKGENGTESTSIIYNTLNGNKTTIDHVDVTTTKPAVDEIVRVGTGVVSEDKQVTTKEVDYKVIENEDKDLPKGERIIDQKGEKGLDTITTTTPLLNGEPNGQPESSVEHTKEPVDEIVRVGVGELTTQTTQNAKSQGFKIIYKDDPTLPKGETKIEREGQNGLIVTTIEQDYVNGKKYGEPRTSTTQNKETIDQIVLVGTKEPAKPVEPIKPANEQYEPKGGSIDKEFGNKTTNDEVINRVSIPDYNGEKPLIIVDDETQIPDGQTPGKYSVSVTVKYPDGSTDHTIVTVNVGEKVSSEKPLPNNKDDNNNKDNGNKDNNNNKDNDNKDANGNKINKDNNIANTSAIKNAVDKQSNELTHKSNTNQTHSTQNLENKDNINEVSNTQSVNHNDNSQTQKAISQHQNEMINKHQETQENMTQSSNKELPKTGQESNRKAGLWASMLALLGGMTLLTRRKTKKEEK